MPSDFKGLAKNRLRGRGDQRTTAQHELPKAALVDDQASKPHYRTDQLKGSKKADILEGSNGADSIDAGSGDDRVEAGKGDDTLRGGKGDDILDGDKGDDTLKGGKGDDTLDGGEGNDLLVGGQGGDFYVISTGNDTIEGYKNGDRIVLSEELIAASITQEDITINEIDINGRKGVELTFSKNGLIGTTSVF